jgi:hypothetical protein
MENFMINGAAVIEQLVETADEAFKRQYLDRIWSMTKIDMFKELMRVHGESTRMMTQAQAEIDNLKAVIAQYSEGLH